MTPLASSSPMSQSSEPSTHSFTDLQSNVTFELYAYTTQEGALLGMKQREQDITAPVIDLTTSQNILDAIRSVWRFYVQINL